MWCYYTWLLYKLLIREACCVMSGMHERCLYLFPGNDNMWLLHFVAKQQLQLMDKHTYTVAVRPYTQCVTHTIVTHSTHHTILVHTHSLWVTSTRKPPISAMGIWEQLLARLKYKWWWNTCHIIRYGWSLMLCAYSCSIRKFQTVCGAHRASADIKRGENVNKGLLCRLKDLSNSIFYSRHQ